MLIHCEKCNVEVKRGSWFNHLKSKTHMENDLDQIIKLIAHIKLCEQCNVQISSSGWSAHLKSKIVYRVSLISLEKYAKNVMLKLEADLGIIT